MRQHGCEPLVQQREQDSGEVAAPPVVRRLDEEVASPADSEPPQLLSVEADDPVQCDLTAWANVERDLGELELRPELGDPLLHQVGGRGPVVTDVRGGGDGDDPVPNSGSGDADAVLDRPGAVVDPRQDVGVKVDHRSTI
jgi:hypothetical protein